VDRDINWTEKFIPWIAVLNSLQAAVYVTTAYR